MKQSPIDILRRLASSFGGVLFLLLLMFNVPLWLASQSHPMRNITVQDGLPSSFVYRAHQDLEGYMWILTDKGVSRYDGRGFEHFTTKQGLISNDNWQAAVSQDGSLWLNSFGGFPFAIQNGQVRIPTVPVDIRGLLGNKNESAIAQGNYLYFQAQLFIQPGKRQNIAFGIFQDTLFLLQASDPNILLENHRLLGDSLRGAFVFSRYQIAGEGKNRYGLFLLREKWLDLHFSISEEAFLEGMGKEPLNSDRSTSPYSGFHLAYLNADSLFFVRENAFFWLSKNGVSEWVDPPLLALIGEKIHRIYRLPNGFFFQTKTRNFLTNSNLSHLPAFDFIDHHHINSITVDDRDNIWVCTRDQGIFLYPNNFSQTRLFHFKSLTGSDNIDCLAADLQGGILIGLDNQHLVRLKADALKALPKLPPMINTHGFGLSGIVCHPDFGMIVGTQEGQHFSVPNDALKAGFSNLKTSDYKPLKWQFPAILSNNFAALKQLAIRDSVLLFSLANGQSKFFRSSHTGKIISTHLPTERSIYASELGADATLWLGTKLGLRAHPAVNSKLIKHAHHKLLQAPVNALTRNAQDALFVGTDGQGVYLLNADTMLLFPETQNFIVSSLAFSEAEQALFVGSNRGILAIHLDSNYRFQAFSITTAHGLPSNEVRCLLISNNQVYIGTNQGLAVLPLPLQLPGDSISPRLYMKRIRINGEFRAPAAAYHLPYDSNQVEIQFSGIAHTSGTQVHYQYRILPGDSAWHTSPQPNLALPALAPGNYTVQMKMYDISNHVSPIVSTQIILSPAFQDTKLFWLLLFGIGFLALFFGFSFRARKARKRLREETRIKKRFSELELHALRAQINPHFIFNLLNSFQRIIIQEDFLLANEYLSKFAKLMRMTLESSRKRTVLISKELELLNLYVSLEQLRFRERFAFAVEIDPAVEVDTLSIPALIIQPFLENAIEHGMRNLGEQGRVVLRMRMDEAALVAEIEDNGNGIAATKPKGPEKQGHVSRGIAIIQDRIAVLGQLDGIRVDIHLADLHAQKQGRGTRVTIHFNYPQNA
ncbi:MAG TPA: hypothetical protein ENJ82_17410 [Bacteroidetes bacterium]|nr:hypothetical protein [Bacteroidota bacterium]